MYHITKALGSTPTTHLGRGRGREGRGEREGRGKERGRKRKWPKHMRKEVPLY